LNDYFFFSAPQLKRGPLGRAVLGTSNEMTQVVKPAARRHQLRELDLHGIVAPQCSKATTILETAHSSADALLKAYELAWSERGKPRGITTDEEQDLLRAMLVLAAAGLDAMAKQVIEDALPALVQKSDDVREGLEKFVARSVRGDVDAPEAVAGYRFLGRVLSAHSPQHRVIEEYVKDLTGGSLQSTAELSKTAAALGLSTLQMDHAQLKEIFDIRNKIIHELDIDLEGKQRKRTLRGRESMMDHTNALLELAEQILKGVNALLGVA
jgi:hypothetical protein